MKFYSVTLIFLEKLSTLKFTVEKGCSHLNNIICISTGHLISITKKKSHEFENMV